MGGKYYAKALLIIVCSAAGIVSIGLAIDTKIMNAGSIEKLYSHSPSC